MLVLSRKRNERIIIADGDVVITVVEIKKDKVRIGIDAPKEIPVHREEIYELIKKQEAEGKQEDTVDDEE